MSQATMNIANMSRTLFRAAVNAAIQALVGQNSGTTEPSETYPYMFWADTDIGRLKMRNGADSGWVDLWGLGDGPVSYNDVGDVDLTGAINDTRGTVAFNATTCDIWNAGGNVVDVTGSAGTLTDLPDAPQAGAMRRVYWPTGTVITNAAPFTVQGGADYTIQSGDAVVVEAVTTTTFRVTVFKADGTSVAKITGGAVTQTTNKSTSVTLNSESGRITMHAASLASATTVTFSLMNSRVKQAGGTVNLTLGGGVADGSAYDIWPYILADGNLRINVRNRTAGSLSEAIVINFKIDDGAIS